MQSQRRCLLISVSGPAWQEVKSDVESGKIDLMSGMFYSEKRDVYVNFSKPYILVSHAIYVREDSDIRGGLKT